MQFKAKVDSYGFRDQYWTTGDVVTVTDKELADFKKANEKRKRENGKEETVNTHPLKHFEPLDKNVKLDFQHDTILPPHLDPARDDSPTTGHLVNPNVEHVEGDATMKNAGKESAKEASSDEEDRKRYGGAKTAPHVTAPAKKK